MHFQLLEAQQQQQLAMLQIMQEAGGFPEASLLSSGSAQGSSNLIYILKSLQVLKNSLPHKEPGCSRCHVSHSMYFGGWLRSRFLRVHSMPVWSGLPRA